MAKLTTEERAEVEAICEQIKELAKDSLPHPSWRSLPRYNELRKELWQRFRVRVRVQADGQVVWKRVQRPRD